MSKQKRDFIRETNMNERKVEGGSSGEARRRRVGEELRGILASLYIIQTFTFDATTSKA